MIFTCDDVACLECELAHVIYLHHVAHSIKEHPAALCTMSTTSDIACQEARIEARGVELLL